jgi:hypothetical protein
LTLKFGNVQVEQAASLFLWTGKLPVPPRWGLSVLIVKFHQRLAVAPLLQICSLLMNASEGNLQKQTVQ